MLALSSLACNLIQNQQPPEFVTPTSSAGAPTVAINSPANGSEVAVGQEVLVQSTAQDSIGVTRIELRANGFIVNTVPSESTTGDRQFSVIQSWRPAEAGSATLEVIAYRGSTPSAPAQITVTVRADAGQITATLQPLPGVTQQPPADTTCRARVEVQGLNFRTGPATNYPIINVLTLGNLVDITGRLADNSWWQVRDGLNYGWISSAYTTQAGDCSAIPIVVPPPSPTPRPATATPTTPPTSTPVPGSATPTFTPTPQVPDLVVASISGPTVLQLNASGTVGAHYDVRLLNQGTGSSGQFTTSFRQPDGTTVQLPIIVNLAPGQTADLGIDVTFTSSDTFRLEATVDSGAQVAERDEGNNVRTLDVVVTNAPSSDSSGSGSDSGGVAMTPLIVITLAP
jgi:hypothetical protein